jgi:hypothetical protein
VGPEARVEDNAWVGGDARIEGSARVCHEAWVGGEVDEGRAAGGAQPGRPRPRLPVLGISGFGSGPDTPCAMGLAVLLYSLSSETLSKRSNP